ncbi:MAG: hypothetical protein MUO53_15940 [Maribacter sp.]|nr:hypothetical protein [Maribacter sp.]
MKKLFKFILGITGLYGLLLVPMPQKRDEPQKATRIPFVWNQDALWKKLENSFLGAKKMPAATLDIIVRQKTLEVDSILDTHKGKTLQANAGFYDLVEQQFFEIAPLIAAQENKSDWYIGFYNRVRKKIKLDSQSWDMGSADARNRTYRILYGLRAAVEEILLQANTAQFVSTLYVSDEPSVTPSVEILGIQVHSGDLLVSRGGAEVSAFISRGNDYPGNFSHVAMIYVEKETYKPYLVEAHIEKGVAIARLEGYLKDKKLRFMVMRPRADLAQMTANPMLPQQASSYIFNESQTRHIPYDFKMDYYDASAMFCSEVGSYAYKQFGIRLWEFESTISSNGIMDWLHNFGVEHFVTQMPSDLEYDPMLSVVAEWRDKEVLFQDHLDNAVMDALLARANAGEKLDYNGWMLPIARIIKAYSFLMNTIGKEGVIPEGMDAVTALKNTDFVDQFQKCKILTAQKIKAFEAENSYVPPYWEMVRMAEASVTH